MRLGARVVAALRAAPRAARLVPGGLAEQLAVMHDIFGRGMRVLVDKDGTRARAALCGVFGRYAADDTWRALFASMDLFRWLARETAVRLGHRYPADLDERVTAWVARFHAAR